MFVLVLACALFVGSCSSDSEGGALVGVLGPAGGVVEVRAGVLAGTALSIDAGVFVQDQALRIEPAAVAPLDGLVAVGPAARMAPVDLVALGTVTLVVDTTQPALVGSDPADVVVVRVAADGQVDVLPPDALDLAVGRVSTRVSGLGTFWVAVRATAEPFLLANFLPEVGDYYEFDSNRVFYLREATSDPGLDAGSWSGWNVTIDPALLLPNYPHAGVYVDVRPDGLLRFGGSYSRSSGFVSGDWQRLLVDPLVVPAAVVEGDEYEGLGGLDTFVPFGSTSAVTQDGAVRVRIGERGVRTVPAGTFGDVVRVTFEVEFSGQPLWSLELDLARGVGPIAIGDATGVGELVAAQARGRTYE